MRNVLFAAPFPLETTMRFARAIAGLADVQLLGVFQEAPRGADVRLFKDIAVVRDGLDSDQLIEAARRLADRQGPLHRVLGILEPLQEPLADVREALGVPGPRRVTAELFRDKARMKDALRAAGLPVARHRVVTTRADAQAFAAEVGFPMVLKPLAGMGCRATWRVESLEAFYQALQAAGAGPDAPVLAEEFLRGREYSFETVTLGGKVCFRSATRYFPSPLEVMESPWIQWCVMHPRSIEGPEFEGVSEIADATISALGLESGMTHMEWFRREDGSIAIGEIAARPPGAHIVMCNGFVHDIDMYRVWARAVVDDAFDGPFERKYAVGTAFLRGMGRGRVVGVSGIEEAQRLVGPLVVASKLPERGALRADGYEGDGWAIVRHPNTEIVKQALKTLIETIRVHYA